MCRLGSCRRQTLILTSKPLTTMMRALPVGHHWGPQMTKPQLGMAPSPCIT